MSLILAAPASGKSFCASLAQNIADCIDGDTLLRDSGILTKCPDPQLWTNEVRMQHMHLFQDRARRQGKICLCFSEVHDVWHFDVLAVVVEIPEAIHQRQVEQRSQHMRPGSSTPKWEVYKDQRQHLRELSVEHCLRVFSNFEDALMYVRSRLTCVGYVDDMPRLRAMIANRGFVVVPNLISTTHRQLLMDARQGLIDAKRKQSEYLFTYPQEHEPTKRLSDIVEQYLNPHLLTGAVSTLPVAQSLLPVFNAILQIPPDQNVHLFNDTLLTKGNAHRSALHWHQDFSFWPLDKPDGVLVLWTPLCHVDAGNGCLRVAVGSHKEQTGPLIVFHSGQAQAGDPHVATFESGDFEVVDLEMDPGDVVLFHPNLFHMSGGNFSDSPRTAWSSVWAVPWTKLMPRRAATHVKSKNAVEGCDLGPFDWWPSACTDSYESKQ